MILKSELKSTITEVCEEHDIVDKDFIDDLLDRLQGVVEVMDDEEEEAEDEMNSVPDLRNVLGEDE